MTGRLVWFIGSLTAVFALARHARADGEVISYTCTCTKKPKVKDDNACPATSTPQVEVNWEANGDRGREGAAISKCFKAYAKDCRSTFCDVTVTAGARSGGTNSAKQPRSTKWEKAAEGSGMQADHVERLAKYADENDLTIVMRFSNPESTKYQTTAGYRPKPVSVKFHTASDGDAAGLVTSAGLSQQQIAGLERGWKFDANGVLRDPEQRGVHGDYDLQGVYEHKDAKVTRRDANVIKVRMALNKAIDPNRTKPHDLLIQHGANDDFFAGTEKEKAMGRLPEDIEPDRKDCPLNATTKKKQKKPENYLVFGPDGSTQQVNGTPKLEEHYKKAGIEWPYNVRRDKKADPCDYKSDFQR
jgi:hypothetical protein